MEESVAGRKGNGQTLRLPLRWGSVSSRLSTCAHGILFVGSKPPPTPGDCDGRQQSQKFHENLNFSVIFIEKRKAQLRTKWPIRRISFVPILEFVHLRQQQVSHWSVVTAHLSQNVHLTMQMSMQICGQNWKKRVKFSHKFSRPSSACSERWIVRGGARRGWANLHIYGAVNPQIRLKWKNVPNWR